MSGTTVKSLGSVGIPFSSDLRGQKRATMVMRCGGRSRGCGSKTGWAGHGLIQTQEIRKGCLSPKRQPFQSIGSPGRTRTCDQSVTSAPAFLLGSDYLFTRLESKGGCRALVRPYWAGSSASKSLHVPAYALALRQASLRVTIPDHNDSGAGFPEFTRCFNHSFLWKLQSRLQPIALPTELPGNAISELGSYCSILLQRPCHLFRSGRGSSGWMSVRGNLELLLAAGGGESRETRG